ncbi:MAG: hypothetical protein QOD54_1099 [Sphingomonadales bacterium]|jgi:hypothetical protein|nr:hypothetical protein [Sphingomonadales bacterium]
MKWLDRGLSCLLILGSIGHTFGVLNFYKDPHTLFWSLTASELIFLLAAINLLRTWRPADRALAAITAAASAAYLLFTLRFGQLIGDMTDFRVILFGVLSLGLTAFGIRDALRAR